ncbi:hypothetical protein LPB142_03615 [Rhodobacter xanthinilyticus]|uniref:Uncharacterized protein n=1 Tax=Rhodobacter xanthinilyticus TaxID=1850250 RepID=A0A1D9M9H1_9RHOB|nr:DUF1178 family protein [Rhodobacter xanthinilyticus]AOZ68515.1 hypothetical protein LPB142_03615 [Rhodobacter xanthinilyticus]
MIRYTLKCDAGHSFESWFKSADAYEALSAEGLVSCAVCGSGRVEKALMTPQLRPQGAATEAPLAPKTEVEEALAAMRREIEANSDYVGLNFAAEARAMHSGAAPERAIHGEARPEEARALLEEGVPVLPLPFLPTRKVN